LERLDPPPSFGLHQLGRGRGGPAYDRRERAHEEADGPKVRSRGRALLPDLVRCVMLRNSFDEPTAAAPHLDSTHPDVSVIFRTRLIDRGPGVFRSDLQPTLKIWPQ
jgi:hypothetical protein